MRDPNDNHTADLVEYIVSGDMRKSPLLAEDSLHIADVEAARMRRRNDAWLRKQARISPRRG